MVLTKWTRIWLLYHALLLTSGLDEHATFTSHFHRLIKLGLAIDNDNGNEDLEDLPALDGDNDNKVSAIEQVD